MALRYAVFEVCSFQSMGTSGKGLKSTLSSISHPLRLTWRSVLHGLKTKYCKTFPGWAGPLLFRDSSAGPGDGLLLSAGQLLCAGIAVRFHRNFFDFELRRIGYRVRQHPPIGPNNILEHYTHNPDGAFLVASFYTYATVLKEFLPKDFDSFVFSGNSPLNTDASPSRAYSLSNT